VQKSATGVQINANSTNTITAENVRKPVELVRNRVAAWLARLRNHAKSFAATTLLNTI